MCCHVILWVVSEWSCDSLVQDPKEADPMMRVQSDLDETKIVLVGGRECGGPTASIADTAYTHCPGLSSSTLCSHVQQRLSAWFVCQFVCLSTCSSATFWPACAFRALSRSCYTLNR